MCLFFLYKMSCVSISCHYEVVPTIPNILIYVKKWGVTRNTTTCYPKHSILLKEMEVNHNFYFKKAQLHTLEKIKFIVEPQCFGATSWFLEVTLKWVLGNHFSIDLGHNGWLLLFCIRLIKLPWKCSKYVSFSEANCEYDHNTLSKTYFRK